MGISCTTQVDAKDPDKLFKDAVKAQIRKEYPKFFRYKFSDVSREAKGGDVFKAILVFQERGCKEVLAKTSMDANCRVQVTIQSMQACYREFLKEKE